MAYARPFGQAQNASPWSAGVPPGIQQTQQAGQQGQPMFTQPMGPFDLSGGWQGQQQAGPQWMPAMQQPVQFVPNPAAFMQQQQQNQHHQMHRQQHQQQQPHMRQQHQQQRPMHQRSLSAPRVDVMGQNKRQFNHNNNNSNNSGNQQRQFYNNNNQQQQRTPRQQSRMNNNSNNNNNDQKNSAQVNNKQQQHNQQNQQQTQKKGTVKVAVKVTKVKKQNALKAKQGVKSDNNATNAASKATVELEAAADDQSTGNKVQSKTAERKQLKLQARKNAEALNKSILPVSKTNTGPALKNTADTNADEPIDQAQLKCVPAVFGFVCKICDVFLKDKIARREHIDSSDHMQKFNIMEEEQKQKSAEEEQKAKASEEEQKAETSTSNTASTTGGEQTESNEGDKVAETPANDDEMKEE